MQLFRVKNKVKLLIFFFIIATIIALLSASVNITSELAEKYSELKSKNLIIMIYPLIDEFTGVYSFCLLVPAIISFFKKFPLKKDNFLKIVWLYFFVSIIIGLTHTSMMFISRSIIYPALNLGNYDYGYIPFRIVMEYLKQFIVFWVVFGIYSIIKINKENEEQRIKTIQLEEQLTKARLETLKMQINPHFLFNTLNMISSTMYDNLESADRMIANLSDLLRITLRSTNKGEHNLENELKILNLYLDIMKARFNDRLKIEINYNDRIKNASVPSFLFQPLVENSIKHGMENLDVTKIYLSIDKKSDKLFIQIKDNGPGIKENDKSILQKGIGLSNTIERLENLYKSNYEFSWTNIDEGGLIINIIIPYSEKLN